MNKLSLEETLVRLDRRPYPAYKDLRGRRDERQSSIGPGVEAEAGSIEPRIALIGVQEPDGADAAPPSRWKLVGASIGVVGTIAGGLLGLVFSKNIEVIRRWLESLTGTDLFAAEIYFLSQLPAEVDLGEVVMVVCMALGLSVLATLYPSWRASRLDPVEALRNE